jgi:hypothetical protein
LSSFPPPSAWPWRRATSTARALVAVTAWKGSPGQSKQSWKWREVRWGGGRGTGGRGA